VARTLLLMLDAEGSVRGGPAAAQAAAAVVERRLGEPFGIGGHTVRISLAVGCASFPVDAGDAEALPQAADAAMYRLKGRSRPREARRWVGCRAAP
jgi:predicted signal transduction protein with EAL and GGDEF domain